LRWVLGKKRREKNTGNKNTVCTREETRRNRLFRVRAGRNLQQGEKRKKGLTICHNRGGRELLNSRKGEVLPQSREKKKKRAKRSKRGRKEAEKSQLCEKSACEQLKDAPAKIGKAKGD